MFLGFMVAALSTPADVRFLQRPEGRVSYELHGADGPWVVCVPGMGDLRSQFRHMVQPLVGAGYRVAMMDLRGLGDSSTGFSDYSAAAVGSDVVALLEELGAEHAFIMGNSMASAAALWAAAEAPERVEGVLLLGPFARDVPAPFYMRPLIEALFAPPWGPRAWRTYYGTLYPERQPADLDTHRDAILRNLSQPGRHGVLMKMLRASKESCWRRSAEVRARALVIMGEQDPDFPSPQAEARLVAQGLKGGMLMVPGAGHYPHVDSAEMVLPAVLSFLRGASHAS